MPDPDWPARMSALAESFHSLAGRPGVRPWDPDKLDRAAAKGGWTGAEVDAARFVLDVWNSHASWAVGRFNFFQAYGRWDEQNRAAFLAWARDPWWP
jgi:hypothetical protein